MVDTVSTLPLPAPPGSAGSNSALGSFFAGPENSLVGWVVERVLKGDFQEFSPLVLIGATNVGKSHLASGIAAAWRQLHPQETVVVVSGSQFSKRCGEAVRDDRLAEFRAEYRRADLLVLEDLHTLAKKETSQRELVQTLDLLRRREARVIATLRAAPRTIAGILPTLASRLSAGLVLGVSAAGNLTREAMLRVITAGQGAAISDRALQHLSKQGDLSVAEMLDVARRLCSESSEVDLRATRAVLEPASATADLSPSRILKTTASYFSLPVRDLKGDRRNRNVVTARALAMYLVRGLTGESLQNIGRLLGGRDHTTVLHHCRKMELLVSSDLEIQEAVAQIRQRLVD